MSGQDAFEEWEERYFGGNYAAFCDEYGPEDEDEDMEDF